MRSRVITETKSKTKIPRIAVIAIIIIFIGLGAKGIKYILNHSPEERQTRASQETAHIEEAESNTLLSFGWTRPAASLSDYQVVVEHDLLKPLGWQKTVATPPPPKPVVQREVRQERPAPTNDLVLTGIVNLGGEPIALMEDTSSGKAYFLKEGDKLKDYLVEAISEKNIVLANGSSRLTPSLGSKAQYDSNGRISISQLTDERAIGGSMKSTDEKVASSDGEPANLSLIERMKARRRRELETE